MELRGAVVREMNCKTVISILAGALLASSQVSAEPLSFDYVYASRIDTEVSNQDADGDTLGFFSEFADRWHVTVSQGDAGWGPAGAKQTTTRFGLGGQLFLEDKTLFAPTFSILNIETKTPSLDSDETAWSLQLDLRHLLYDQVELVGGLRYLDRKSDSTSGAEIGLMYHFSDWVAAGGIFRREDDIDSTEWTIRFYY